jgi:hypothetical protein
MFNRRTLAAFTAVAALAGGTAGGVTSSFTAPDGAHAAVPPPTIGKILSPRVIQVNSDVLREALRTDTDRIRAIERSVNALTAKVDAVNARTVDLNESLDGLSRMVARSPQGQSLIGMVGDIQQKSRLICAETVGEVLLGADRHVLACD